MIFRPENVFTTFAQATELRDITGLALPELVIFRPQRPALHELLVRLTADYEVPEPEGAKVSSAAEKLASTGLPRKADANTAGMPTARTWLACRRPAAIFTKQNNTEAGSIGSVVKAFRWRRRRFTATAPAPWRSR